MKARNALESDSESEKSTATPRPIILQPLFQDGTVPPLTGNERRRRQPPTPAPASTLARTPTTARSFLVLVSGHQRQRAKHGGPLHVHVHPHLVCSPTAAFEERLQGFPLPVRTWIGRRTAERAEEPRSDGRSALDMPTPPLVRPHPHTSRQHRHRPLRIHHPLERYQRHKRIVPRVM